MSREEFLAALKKKLKGLPKEELASALSYYSEYLEEGSVEELGSVDEIAGQILDQCAINRLNSEDKGGSLKTLWIVLLAIFAAPVAIPLAVAFGAVILAVIVCIAAVLLSFGVCGVAFGLSGIFISVVGAVIVSAAPVNMLMVIGIGFMLAGMGVLLLVGTFYAGKVTLRLMAKLLGLIIKKRS